MHNYNREGGKCFLIIDTFTNLSLHICTEDEPNQRKRGRLGWPWTLKMRLPIPTVVQVEGSE